MNISKKKKNEFDEIFNLFSNNDFFLDIEKFRQLYNSDFFNHFLLHVDDKIKSLLEKNNHFILHIDINLFNLADLNNYDKILEFAKILHKYTLNLSAINIYNSSYLFKNLINMLSSSLNFNINNKIIFQKKNEINELNQKIDLIKSNL